MLPALHLAFEDGTTPHEVRIRLSAGARPVGTIFFRCEAVPLVANADALLCLGLIPAMEVGAPLRVEGTVDPALLANAEAIQDLLCSWYPAYRRIPVQAEAAMRSYPAGRGTALFYSGGIDSSHSLAQAKDRLDALVTIVDASAPRRSGPGGERLVSALGQVAVSYGLQPIIVETNVRAMMQPFLGWIEFHGSAMAAIRHLLADRFETVLIASSGDETAWFTPWGSHPALDPLLGTAGARIEHHGLVKRLDKVRTILTEPPLMQRLHVCNSDPRVNCGRCTKCRFAMACLTVLDAAGDAPTFPRDRDDAPRRFRIVDDAIRSEYAHLRDAAAATGRCEGLVGDVDRALAAYDGSKRRRSFFDADSLAVRLKRAKHRARYWRASR
ncbi:hypothetical protein [Aquibium sp. ELW1220]|uniref:hypothetical protein n=1 Tax=Aquibium sp. ELW1220 TaxID=2976766 RepID=UPI0025B035C5|nr:hypothetical protein [Aquibium sp. ELW1220]MDN2580144.1 hypothetical protein [Aquibium sp. ELW1220]